MILAAVSRKYPEIRICLLINRGQPRQFLSGRNPSVSASPIQLPLHKGADNNFICENKNVVILPEELRRYWHISASAHPPRPQVKSPPHSECRGLKFVFLLRKYLAHETGSCACGVGLIGIDVHGGGAVLVDADDHVVEDQLTTERPFESILTLTICLS